MTRERKTKRWRQQERTPSTKEVGLIVAVLTQMGIAQRELQVNAAHDTSDQWRKLHLNVVWNENGFQIDLDTYASGFEGRDAPLLRRFLQLVAAAGAPSTGPPQPG